MHGLETGKVCSLMSMNEKRLDSDILNDLFSARDMDLILKVPLSIREENDGWSSHMERRREYTVKSGYRHLLGERRSQGGEDLGWVLIWKLSVQAKVKNFLWRAGAGILPTIQALHGMRIVNTSLCPCCRDAIEDTLHAVFRCSTIKYIWTQALVEVNSRSSHSFVEWCNEKNSYGRAADGSHYMLGNLEQEKSIGLEWEENFRWPGVTISTTISGAMEGYAYSPYSLAASGSPLGREMVASVNRVYKVQFLWSFV